MLSTNIKTLEIMKVAKNNSSVKINTNSKEWKFVIYNPDRLDLAIYKARTLKRAEKKASYFDGWIVDELIFENENLTLEECKLDYKIVQDNTGKQYKVKRGKEFLNLMMKLQLTNKL